MNKTAKRIVGIFVIAVLWVFYLMIEEFSFYGIYSLVDYSVTEIFALIPYLCCALTFAWVAVLLINIIKKKSDKSGKYFVIVFAILLALQIGYIINETTYSTTTLTSATVESVDTENNTITFKVNSNDENFEDVEIVLDVPQMITDMVEANGKKYTVTYKHRVDNYSEGKLSDIGIVQQ